MLDKEVIVRLDGAKGTCLGHVRRRLALTEIVQKIYAVEFVLPKTYVTFFVDVVKVSLLVFNYALEKAYQTYLVGSEPEPVIRKNL